MRPSTYIESKIRLPVDCFVRNPSHLHPYQEYPDSKTLSLFHPMLLKFTAWKVNTWGNRLSGLVLGPPVDTAGCGACSEGFGACPTVGDLTTAGTSACSGMP